ncbi:hypothetical protein Tco_0824376 [Tanacetum coccineum]|uniref:Reverse transcriptase domain-containing protein n=1 Tax=Tanacetum coccineum TaxID=301880 RepID=A0ABQ5ANZ6_9ASTR
MMAIFHDMIEKTIEVFMDDFSVFGDSFDSCLSNLEKMLKRFCEDKELVLNWEKCHFMCREGIVLGHKISKSGIEVDRAKVDVIAKLPHPTTVKGVRSFLGHVGFYRRFIEEFSKIARPMTHLLEIETPFVFSKDRRKLLRSLKACLEGPSGGLLVPISPLEKYLMPIDEDVENENSNVLDSDEPVLLNSPLSDKVECSDPEDEINEIDAFLAMEVSSNFEEGYFDSEGDVIFLKNLLSDDTTHNLAPKFAGELITLPLRIVREHEDYLNRMTLLYEISTSMSQENVHANSSSIIESLLVSPIPVEDSDPVQEEIDIFLVPDDLITPGVENDDSEDEDNELPNLDHQDNPSSPRPLPEPLDVCLNFKPATTMRNEDFNQGEIVLSLNVEDINSFTFVIWTSLIFFTYPPFFTYPKDSPLFLSTRSEHTIFDPVISTFHFSLKPVSFALPKDK